MLAECKNSVGFLPEQKREMIMDIDMEEYKCYLTKEEWEEVLAWNEEQHEEEVCEE